MAAQLLDEVSENEVFDTLPSVEDKIEDGVTQEPVAEEPALPEKYQGKGIEEIARMHQEAERLIGRQSQEVGELRRLADEYIKTNLTAPATPEEPVDFYEDPDKAVSQAIERHPSVQAATRAAEQMNHQSAQARLVAAHPDAAGIVSSEGFVSWVQGSPTRIRLYQEAEQQYNYDSANELLSLYKERIQHSADVAAADKKQRSVGVKQASTGNVSGGGSTAKKGRIFRRADIVNLMKTDPDRYDALQPEIMKAYTEGRVK
jgi:hypothetical protein